jgi:hypothetical protein
LVQVSTNGPVGGQLEIGEAIAGPRFVLFPDYRLKLLSDVRDGRTLEVETHLLPDVGHQFPKPVADPRVGISLEMIQGDQSVQERLPRPQAPENVEMLL